MEEKNVILLFKKDNSMNNLRWKRFCQRYKGKNVDSIVRECAVQYKGIETKRVSCSFKKKLKQAINETVLS